jgi:hypothetical protein
MDSREIKLVWRRGGTRLHTWNYRLQLQPLNERAAAVTGTPETTVNVVLVLV